MKSLLLISGLSLGLLTFIACGTGSKAPEGSTGGGVDDGAPDNGSGVGGANEVTAEEFVNSDKMNTADNIYSIMTFSPVMGSNPLPSMNMFMGPMGTLSAKSMDGSRWTCSGNSSGNLEDKDGDYIPVDGLFEFDCNMASSQWNASWQGTINVKDDDDNDKKSGWDSCTGTINNDTCSREPIVMTVQSNMGNFRLDRIFDFDLDKQAAYVFNTFFYQWKGYQDNDLKVSVTVNGDGLSFDEEDDGDDEIFDNGTWNGSVSVTVTDHQNSESGTCNVNFDNLHVSEECDGADSGAFEITCDCPQGSQVTLSLLRINFTRCGSGSVYMQDCDGYTQNISF